MGKIELIKSTVEELLQKMSFDGEVSVQNDQEDNIVVQIKTKEAGFLIGQAGVSLDALQHLARVLVNRKNIEPVKFILDVNNYRRHRLELLRELAKDIAQQAISERVAITLQPMSAYERRVIHLSLSAYPQIITESIGQEPKRRIVVRVVK